MKKAVSVMLALTLFFSFYPNVAYVSTHAAGKDEYTENVSEQWSDENQSAGTESDEFTQSVKVPPYIEYIVYNGQAKPGKNEVTTDIYNYIIYSGKATVDGDFLGLGKKALVLDSDAVVSWVFNVPDDGLYILKIDGIAAEPGSGDIEISLKLNGSVPFQQATSVRLPRTYIHDGDIKQNIVGNDVKPSTIEQQVWREYTVSDAVGFVGGGFLFLLKKGENVLELSSSRGALAIAGIRFCPNPVPIAYDDYIADITRAKNKTVLTAEDLSFVEGEDILNKTATTIVPVADRESPLTFPQSASHLRLNTLGNWSIVGSSVTWAIEVKKDGFYTIAPRFRQNTAEGIFTSRKLLIDGELPFAEAANLRFNYSPDWQLSNLGGQDPYLFWLDAGEHTITLEAVLGDTAQIVGQIEESLMALNKAYRKITLITGPSPDIYRDYKFNKLIPDVIDTFKEHYDKLTRAVQQIDSQVGVSGSYTSVIKKIIFQLGKMYADPSVIAKNLIQFQANLGALGTWLHTALAQPLQIDRIYFVPEGHRLPKPDVGFFQKLFFSIKCFANTFFMDYTSIGQLGGGEGTEKLTVWMQTRDNIEIARSGAQMGRDQAEIMRRLIDSSSFCSDNNAAVNLQLVPAGTLLQSVLSGRGPDVVLNNARNEPIDYALRNANVDLTVFPDFDAVTDWFHERALISYTYKGHVYALPETFTFPVFFYRKDIFEEFGFFVPKTWQDVIKLIPRLQKNNMSMAFPTGLDGYTLMLYQNGGHLYINDGERSNLNSKICLETFTEWTNLFTLYGLPVQYDFANRFRSGEMPCGIQDYNYYNQLTVFAPEINGLWEFVPLPFKTGPDGQERNVTVGTGYNSMILSGAKNKQLAWEFLKWWLSADTQCNFAKEMESILGAAGKYMTANLDALSKMTWSKKEYSVLLEQYRSVTMNPEVPGGYYLSRTIQFAFNNVYNNGAIPSESLAGYVHEFNSELSRKNREFNPK